MNTKPRTVGTVEREREIETHRKTYNLETKTSIFPYALLKLFVRDG